MMTQEEHNCYLFQCGDSSMCIFTEHKDYWMSSVSKHTHSSHSYTPGGATYSHENQLQNLGNHDSDVPKVKVTTTPVPVSSTTTTTATTTTERVTKASVLPGLGQYCKSYESQCGDLHAECLMKKCQCRSGYHAKNDMCRQICHNDEFECETLPVGSSSHQCLPIRYMCDGRPDCADESDEQDCADKGKPAFLDTDTPVGGSLYNNPYYNSGFNLDNQYPYAFPLPGLANRKQPALQPSTGNQLYPNQLPVNNNGGYYIPGLANQNQGNLNILPPAGNQQWGNKNILGSQLYNNIPYQQQHQMQGYLPAPNGFNPMIPVLGQQQPNIAQNHPGQAQSPYIQKTDTVTQKKPAKPTPVPVASKPPPMVPTKPPVTQASGQKPDLPDFPDIINDLDYFTNSLYDTATEETVHNKPDKYADDLRQSFGSYVDNGAFGRDGKHPSASGTKPIKHEDMDTHWAGGRPSSQGSQPVGDGDTRVRGRTFPSATKAKTQIVSPTQSTVPGQKAGQESGNQASSKPSENFFDYSWIGYDKNSPSISGKKGTKTIASSSRKNNQQDYQKSKSKSPVYDIKPDSKLPDSDINPSKMVNGETRVKPNRYDDIDDYGFDDLRKPAGNRRPGYDRYDSRYDNTRRRPGSGSRYPYYDTGYQRGRNRNPYPIWDPFKDEYYYPDTYDDQTGRSDPSVGHTRKGSKPGSEHPDDKTSAGDSGGLPERPLAPVTQGPPAPITPVQPVVTDAVTKSQPTPAPQAPVYTEESHDQGEEMNADETASSDNDQNQSNEIQTNENDSKVSNSTDTSGSGDGKSEFHILNEDLIEVETYTDGSQGPIVALSLGLAITLMLLIFVGCRLRTVKRRLRKGRALHTNEADYLINGITVEKIERRARLIRRQAMKRKGFSRGDPSMTLSRIIESRRCSDSSGEDADDEAPQESGVNWTPEQKKKSRFDKIKRCVK
ncbi:LRP11-like protein [Mya arenaria]|uniref:LRP11-like protein n=1 Tax=Mya arenaria TaxID=6604 RepID=A0ABY7FCP8_MYAAR|nr:LRP11-like protein [Mya arenaria]